MLKPCTLREDSAALCRRARALQGSTLTCGDSGLSLSLDSSQGPSFEKQDPLQTFLQLHGNDQKCSNHV